MAKTPSLQELQKKINALKDNDKFIQSYGSIYRALIHLEDTDKPAKLKLDMLDAAIAHYKNETKFWQVFRKARLAGLSAYAAAKRQELLPGSVQKKGDAPADKTLLSPEKIYASGTQGLVQGPRMKSDATIEFEEVVRGLLTKDPKKISCHYNKEGELEIKIENKKYNLTDILRGQPDFEQLTFSDEELKKYVAFIEQIGLPVIEVNGGQYGATEENYAKNDPEQSNKHLHYAEKLAITTYSGIKYFSMQRFLRNFARREENSETKETPQAMLQRVKQSLLGIAIASHGLSKPLSVDLDPGPTSFEVLQRGEVTVETVDTQRRQDATGKKVTSNPGFISTTSDSKTAESFSGDDTTQIMFIKPKSRMGHDIEKLSSHPQEKETLLVPGTQYKIVDYKKEGKLTNIAAVPVRTIENVPDPYAYSKDKFIKRLEAIKNRLEALQDEKVNVTAKRTEFQSVQKALTEEEKRINDWIQSKRPKDLSGAEMILESEATDMKSIRDKMGEVKALHNEVGKKFQPKSPLQQGSVFSSQSKETKERKPTQKPVSPTHKKGKTNKKPPATKSPTLGH